MAYSKTTWINQIKDVLGNILQQGTKVNATNMNKIEQGIWDAHNEKVAKSGDTLTGGLDIQQDDGTYKITNSDGSFMRLHFDAGHAMIHIWNSSGTMVNEISLDSSGNITSFGMPLLKKPYCKVYSTADIAVASNNYFPIPFNTELEKSDPTMHSNSSSTCNIYAPISGLYRIVATVCWQGNVNCEKLVDLKKNSEWVDKAVIGTGTLGSANGVLTAKIDGLYRFSAGDYAQLVAWHNNGSSISISNMTRFEMIWERP